MRVMDVFLAIPNMLLALGIAASLGTGQLLRMYCRAEESIIPHSAVGGWIPSPRKLRPQAHRMPLAMPMVPCTMSIMRLVPEPPGRVVQGTIALDGENVLSMAKRGRWRIPPEN